MKNTKIIISIIVLSLGLGGCTDWLSIRPEGQTVLDDFWKSESQATSVLASCYKGLSNYGCMERMLVWGEVRSDNVVSGMAIASNLDLAKVLSQNISPTNVYADWASFYSVINYCNTFLHYAPGVMNSDQNFTLAKLHALESEALAIRALCYFYLVRAYKDVPLVLEPSINDTQDYAVAKAKEREILDQIISDLLTAKKYARVEYSKGEYNKGRFTLTSINALLADVYLWDGQYANCVDACNSVLADNTLALVAGEDVISDVFYKGNSTESIFELQFDKKDIQYNYLTANMYGIISSEIAAALSFPKFLTRAGDYSPFNYAASAVKESQNDIRETNFYGTTVNGTGYSIYKYALSQCVLNSDQTVTPVYRSSGSTTNWIVYRKSDVLLMKAEALVQLNNGDNGLKEALHMVNTTYSRSNMTSDTLQFSNYSDRGAMEKLVLRERQRELMFEGKRWFDLMRLVRRNNNSSSVILSYISPKLSGNVLSKNKLSVIDALYMPIPKSELDVNPNLVQNPFYENTSTQSY
ncbi:MAG: RagB/SusD family nutrient uptake outer membrane protein [Paludibacter sp.]